MRTRYLYLAIVALTIFLSSCKKEVIRHSVAPPIGADVYVAGAVGPAQHAAYWKNGDLVLLTPASSAFSLARSIAVNSTGVYAAGDISGNTLKAVYWLNGATITLSDTTVNADALSIALSGNDVYVAGWQADAVPGHGQHAMLWKNGIPTQLAGGVNANAVVISGSDVYVAGNTTDGVAAYWKNGQITTLPDGFIANAIAVNGSDVYVGGMSVIGSILTWKNGVSTQLVYGAANATISWVTGIAVSGSDTYLAGAEPIGDNGLAPTIWKNNVADNLTVPSGMSSTPSNNVATGIALFNGDVYVAVQVNNNATQQFHPYYYKNDDTPVQLQDAGHGAISYGIAVVPKNVQ